ncbi:MAG: type II toxin-antitoxin system HipA family toxin [Pseudomonadota bacterium]
MQYPATTAVEVHHAGAWRVAGHLRASGANTATFAYDEQYVFGNNPHPVSLTLPVGLSAAPMVEGLTGPEPDRRPPSFIYDLVPQGRGRKFLLDALRLPDSDDMVMPLVMAGAFNPVGCIRLSSALDFYRDEAVRNPDARSADGFALQDIERHSETFLDHIALHAMLASGTTGVQGVAPKLLLAVNAGGSWFADLALPDENAREHWLVKLPRGRSDDDRLVLRNEAAYLEVAARCGLRTHHKPMLLNEMLFVRRFDREVRAGQLHRLHQESLASLVGQRGFGAPHSQQSLLRALRAVVDDPIAETVEFIKRDVLNLALRNTDNHARNTAVQRTVDGRIQLTPVFDFAPMFKDPEVVPRSCHWRDAKGVTQSSWLQVLESLDIPPGELALIAAELVAFAGTVAQLEAIARDCGVEASVLGQCLRTIEEQTRQLEQLGRLKAGHG